MELTLGKELKRKSKSVVMTNIDLETGEIKKGATRNKWGKFLHSGFEQLGTMTPKLTPNETRVLFLMMSVVKAQGFCFITQARFSKKLSLSPSQISMALKELTIRNIVEKIDKTTYRLSNRYFGG